jgi:hypothetical protein
LLLNHENFKSESVRPKTKGNSPPLQAELSWLLLFVLGQIGAEAIVTETDLLQDLAFGFEPIVQGRTVGFGLVDFVSTLLNSVLQHGVG